jgi:hypothetical protein
MDRKLRIERLHPYMLIENELKSQRALFVGLEPEKDGYVQRKEAAFAASIPDWLPELDKFRTINWAEVERELSRLSFL